MYHDSPLMSQQSVLGGPQRSKMATEVNRLKRNNRPLRGRTFKRINAKALKMREKDIERWTELFSKNAWKA